MTSVSLFDAFGTVALPHCGGTGSSYESNTDGRAVP